DLRVHSLERLLARGHLRRGRAQLLRNALLRRAQGPLRLHREGGRLVAPRDGRFGLGALGGDALAQLGPQAVRERLDGGTATLQEPARRLAYPRGLRPCLERREALLDAADAIRGAAGGHDPALDVAR